MTDTINYPLPLEVRFARGLATAPVWRLNVVPRRSLRHKQEFKVIATFNASAAVAHLDFTDWEPDDVPSSQQ